MRTIDCVGRDFRELSAEILGRGSALRFRARGESMRPFIRGGDLIEVVAIAQGAPRLGDIAFYWTSAVYPRAHRVVKKWAQNDLAMVQTRGDSCTRTDPPIPLQHVLGIVVAVRRGDGWRRLDRGLFRALGLLWCRSAWLRTWVYPALALWKARVNTILTGERVERRDVDEGETDFLGS